MSQLYFSVIIFMGVVMHTQIAGVLFRVLLVGFIRFHAASHGSVCMAFTQFNLVIPFINNSWTTDHSQKSQQQKDL